MVTRLRHAVSTQVNKVPTTASLGNGMKIIFLFETDVNLGHQEKNNQKIMTLTAFREVTEPLSSLFGGHFHLSTQKAM